MSKLPLDAMKPLLVELGTEELPVKALPGLAQAIVITEIMSSAPIAQRERTFMCVPISIDSGKKRSFTSAVRRM